MTQEVAFFQPIISPVYSSWTIPGWYFSEDIHVQFPEIPPTYIFDAEGSKSFSESFWVESQQEVGTFVLQLSLRVYFNFGQSNEEIITLKSNTVIITVQ